LPDVLTPAQRRRLRQLGLHASGLWAFFHPDVEKVLALTDEQKAGIDAIARTLPEPSEHVRARTMKDSLKTRHLAERRKIPRILNLLDERQKRAWRDLVGNDPFRGDAEMQVRWGYGIGILPSRTALLGPNAPGRPRTP
jgi:hypothetical protein